MSKSVARGASGALLCEACAELASLLAIAVKLAPEPVGVEAVADPSTETRTRETREGHAQSRHVCKLDP